MTNNYQISSNFTLFYKIFIPTFWITFFGVFTVILFFFDENKSFVFSNQFRIPFLIIFLVFLALILLTIMRLKRVEFNPENWNASNYLNTYQYNYLDIEKITTTNLIVMKLACIHLHTKGSLGKKLPIILNDAVFNQFVERYPTLIPKSKYLKNIE